MPVPAVSVLVAAYRLQHMVPAAVASVLARAVGAAVEVVVASDDGTDYAPLVAADPRVRFTPVGPVATGAHAARNRALGIATASHVMILDGDDTLEGPPDAIAGALAMAGTGAVVVPTIIRAPGGAEIRRIPAPRAAHMGFAEWREAFASLHLIAPRVCARPFADFRLIDDVIFDLRALAAIGGVAPVAASLAYRYQLRPGQATDTAGARFDAEYARALAAIGADGFGFGSHAVDAARVLRRWRAMNRLVGGGGARPALGDYHRAVAGWLARRG